MEVGQVIAFVAQQMAELQHCIFPAIGPTLCQAVHREAIFMVRIMRWLDGPNMDHCAVCSRGDVSTAHPLSGMRLVCLNVAVATADDHTLSCTRQSYGVWIVRNVSARV